MWNLLKSGTLESLPLIRLELNQQVKVKIMKSQGILYEKDYSGNFKIAPYESEFIENK